MSPANPQAPLFQTKERDHFPATHTHLITSRYVPQTYQIQVLEPTQKRGTRTAFPVVYITDGNATFDMLKGICQLLHASPGEVAPFILVAIGYPGDSPVAGEQLRGRDLTFPGCPNFCANVDWPWEGVLRPEHGGKDFGGADDFQAFIERELIPFIDAHYATTPGDRTYFGHSAGGGFGLYTLLTKNSLFRNYMVSSPILSYQGIAPDGVCYDRHDFVLERTREFLRAGHSLDGIRLCLSVGSEEEFSPTLANWRFTSSLYRYSAFLKAASIPGFECITKVFETESHITVWPRAFIHGVRAVLGAGAGAYDVGSKVHHDGLREPQEPL